MALFSDHSSRFPEFTVESSNCSNESTLCSISELRPQLRHLPKFVQRSTVNSASASLLTTDCSPKDVLHACQLAEIFRSGAFIHAYQGRLGIIRSTRGHRLPMVHISAHACRHVQKPCAEPPQRPNFFSSQTEILFPDIPTRCLFKIGNPSRYKYVAHLAPFSSGEFQSAARKTRKRRPCLRQRRRFQQVCTSARRPSS